MRWLGPRSLNLTTPYGEVLCAGFASTSIITVFNCCFYYHIFLHLSGRETKAARAVANWLALLPPAVVILCSIYIYFFVMFVLLLRFQSSNLYMLILRPVSVSYPDYSPSSSLPRFSA